MGEFGIAPTEYWSMTPYEIQILIEAKRTKYAGGIHEDDLESLHKRRAELEAQGYNML